MTKKNSWVRNFQEILVETSSTMEIANEKRGRPQKTSVKMESVEQSHASTKAQRKDSSLEKCAVIKEEQHERSSSSCIGIAVSKEMKLSKGEP